MSSARRKRNSSKRTTTGCLCCRLRRKKCDERTPTCIACDRNGLICSWPESSADSNRQSSESGWKQRLLSGVTNVSQNVPSGALDTTAKNTELQDKHSRYSSGRVYKLPAAQLIAPVPGGRFLRDSKSRILFEHYSIETARLLSGNTSGENPFITHVLPSAYSDNLIMQTALALSGAHLYYKQSNTEIFFATWSHYAQALQGIKYALTRTSRGEQVDTIRLLLATLLLCHIESVSGNFHGAVFHHLRASRQFALKLLAEIESQKNQEICGFLLELYVYLASVSIITLSAKPNERTVALDSALFSVSSWKECKTFGTMFGCAFDLFKLIPQVSQFGQQRLVEIEQGECSTDSITQYKSLEKKICNWQPPEHSIKRAESISGLITAARIYQQALLIFLHTGFYGSDVTSPDLRKQISRIIDMLWAFMFSFLTASPASPLLTTMLWPSIIMGSCLEHPEQRDFLRRSLLCSDYDMRIISRVVQVLDWLWEDESDFAYGPYGLELIMKKHGVILCMA